jgi:hypothetical protein
MLMSTIYRAVGANPDRVWLELFGRELLYVR